MWKRLAIIFAVVCLALMPSVSLAANPTVTITVSVWVVGAPSGLTVTYLSEYEVQLDWTKGTDAENTMIRGAYDREPTSRTDGFEVYYGDAETTIFSTNLETLSVPIYFIAYSENAEGEWEETGSNTDDVRGVTMLLWILMSLAVAMTIVSAIFKKAILIFAAMGGWLLVIIQSYPISDYPTTFDIYIGLSLFSLAMIIFNIISIISLFSRKNADDNIEGDDWGDIKAEMEEMQREREGMAFLYKAPKSKRMKLL